MITVTLKKQNVRKNGSLIYVARVLRWNGNDTRIVQKTVDAPLNTFAGHAEASEDLLLRDSRIVRRAYEGGKLMGSSGQARSTARTLPL